MLLTKNAELINEMKAVLSGIVSKSLDLENYIIETDFGNKIVKGSIAPPEVTKIALEDIRHLKHKIDENNVIINKLRKSLPVSDPSSSDLASILIDYGMIDGVLVKINEGSTDLETIDGKIIILGGGV